jgi:hypothetical protein
MFTILEKKTFIRLIQPVKVFWGFVHLFFMATAVPAFRCSPKKVGGCRCNPAARRQLFFYQLFKPAIR